MHLSPSERNTRLGTVGSVAGSRVNLLKCLGLKPQSIWVCLIIGDTTEFPVSSGISTGIIGILGYFLCFQANLAKPIN